MKELELGKLYKIDSVDKKDRYHCFAEGTIVVTLRKPGKSMPNYWECARLYRFCNESVRQTIYQGDLIELTEEDYDDLAVIINEDK